MRKKIPAEISAGIFFYFIFVTFYDSAAQGFEKPILLQKKILSKCFAMNRIF